LNEKNVLSLKYQWIAKQTPWVALDVTPIYILSVQCTASTY